MVRNISITLLVWGFFHMMFEPDYAALYASLIDYVTARQTAILAWGLLGAALLVVGSYLCSFLGMYLLMYLLAKVFSELSQLAVAFVSVLSLVIWFAIERNVWLDAAVVTYVLLYAFLGASALSLYIFDFNYPLKDKLASHAVLPILATLVTGFAMFIF